MADGLATIDGETGGADRSLSVDAGFHFDNRYARLPERFFVRKNPATVREPRLLALNSRLAQELGLDPQVLREGAAAAFLSGNVVPEGAEPLAAAYAGHQFGGFVPQLGDGRAILLGEVRDKSGRHRDIQLKGAGKTPFSRMGDGRAAIGPVLREYIVSEAMHALGIATTRSLAAVATGEPVLRETVLPGAVLTRVATSHVRVGTFQYFAARQDREALEILVRHMLDDHDLAQGGPRSENPALNLFGAVVERQARLVAQWMAVGFIHGVMNTDNMSIVGETIDYGPCAFLDTFHPGTVLSSIDHQGRYAYGNQPQMASWNLARLAETLLPLIDPDQDTALAQAQEALDRFPVRFAEEHRTLFCRKLGFGAPTGDDEALVNDVLTALMEGKADFTRFFRSLSEATSDDLKAVRREFTDPAPFDRLAERWRARVALSFDDDAKRREAMCAINPAIIPRNHLVEEALDAATDGDLRPFEALTEALGAPFDSRLPDDRFSLPPRPEEVVRETFCGT